MENRGLLFIPDISGFTRFVNETEIDHSRLIIQELLEILINANNIGLEVSEIEGDAILFYKYGTAPKLEQLYSQVERMFCAFHRHLNAYDLRKYCQCKACTSAVHLSLKVITHYGEFTGYNVKHFNKLIGKDVIVAHQLLKNDIEQHEYWLVTKSLLEDNPAAGVTEKIKWDSSTKQTEAGEVSFLYTPLTELKIGITPEPYPQRELARKAKMISLSKEYDADIITLFHASGDFNYRSRWQEGVKSVEEVNHFLPRIGMRCRSIMEDGVVTTYSTSYLYQSNRIEFSETDDKQKNSTYFILEQKAPRKTKLTINYYIKKNLLSQILFNLTRKKKMEETLRKSMQNLESLVKEIKLPPVE